VPAKERVMLPTEVERMKKATLVVLVKLRLYVKGG
jgi:hypothetical protein